MTLRALIIGIMVWIPSTFFANASWSQSQPNRVKPAKCGYSYDYSYPTATLNEALTTTKLTL
jgi:hypothetical protein